MIHFDLFQRKNIQIYFFTYRVHTDRIHSYHRYFLQNGDNFCFTTFWKHLLWRVYLILFANVIQCSLPSWKWKSFSLDTKLYLETSIVRLTCCSSPHSRSPFSTLSCLIQRTFLHISHFRNRSWYWVWFSTTSTFILFYLIDGFILREL